MDIYCTFNLSRHLCLLPLSWWREVVTHGTSAQKRRTHFKLIPKMFNLWTKIILFLLDFSAIII